MPPAVAPGTTIENYHIEAVIGAGSMGDVFRGVDQDLKRRVAIKILSERHRDNRELRARFVREARAVAAIAHPNVVQVFTTGSYDDRPYIAMEFLDGIDLGTSVAQGGPWSSVDAARAIRDAARGLAAAARAGLIHRDVKPTNLVRLQDGTVKVTDFGLAKPLEPGDEPALTAMGVVVGTPDYIAPEQARGDSIDHRVDIYALGGSLYYLLTGIPPFRTGRPGDDKYLKVVARHLRQPAPDARTRNPRANRQLAELARTMMAKKPDQRPTYEALIAQLDPVVEQLANASEPSVPPQALPAPADGSGGRVAPTPFIGGNSAPVAAPRQQPLVHDSIDENAPTQLRLPQARDRNPPLVVKARLPRWLIVLTIVSVITFLAGLGLALLGPAPQPSAPATSPTPASPQHQGR